MTCSTEYRVKKNQTFRRSFLLTENGEPYGLTGVDVRMQVRDRPGGNTLYLDLTEQNGGVTVTANRIDLFADFTAVATFTGHFDILLIYPSGDRFQLASGTFVLTDGVTSA